MIKTVECVKCGAKVDFSSNFCTKCGTPVVHVEKNACINSSCERHISDYPFKDNDMYCDMCGKPTSYGNRVLKAL